jgi:DSF synthase
MRGRSKTARRQDRETPDGALRSKFELRKAAALVSLRRDIVVEAPFRDRVADDGGRRRRKPVPASGMLREIAFSEIFEQWLKSCQQYKELEVSYDASDKVLWCFMKPRTRPSVTLGLARESRDLQRSIKRLFGTLAPGDEPPIRYMVWGSSIPGIFNLGGDLRLFAELIRAGDREGLCEYAVSCIDVVYANAVSLDLPIITISLVEGEALGGGFEAAISSDLVVAERSARFALPEVLFNVFPGMGAYSLIARRTTAALAQRMILGGRVHTAEEMYDLGLVDLLVEPGQARATLSDHIAKISQRHNAQCAVYKVGKRVNPVSYDELYDIAMIWVDTVLRLSEADLKKMERLARAQDRRHPLQPREG